MSVPSCGYFLSLPVTFLLLIAGGFFNAEVFAQQNLGDVYEGTATVQVQGENYVVARKKALNLALKNGLKEALKEAMGDEEFEASQGDLRKILRRASSYVKSYRFAEAHDDPFGKTSEVRLEMRFFSSAVRQALARLGVVTGLVSENKLVVLIKETSFTSAPVTSFWDIFPISETQLVKNLMEEGIEVIGREQVREMVSETTVLNAIKGDLKSARSIGLKTGADIVIVGTAVSSLRGKTAVEEIKTVQANINVKVVSTLESSLIAAKTDFSTIKHEYALQAELEAFDNASEKLADFLIPSFHRYWEKGVEAPVKKVPEAPPLSMTDM
ncbi:MAG: DUF2066 domain-containing protein [Nitrospinaceae bacterium]